MTNQSLGTLKESNSISDSNQKEVKKSDVPLELLKKFGKAYANYKGLQDRNKRRKKMGFIWMIKIVVMPCTRKDLSNIFISQ
ncbi:hypothetical protein [Enterococcus sp. DIV1420a]|uniref:hypothetical protein n=1 Tax=Enterococcus sp. DIV1420a TaxID=2774672 RepID=UPI003F1FC6F4